MGKYHLIAASAVKAIHLLGIIDTGQVETMNANAQVQQHLC